MTVTVDAFSDPRAVLDRAARFLADEPVLNNVVLTLLHGRVAHPEPGRYWVASSNGRVTGVVFQSPRDFVATITPMDQDVVTATVDAIATAGIALPGVSGEATTTAHFAGAWTERTKSGAKPVLGQRVYEVAAIVPPRPTKGALRRATTADRNVLVRWLVAFQDEIGERLGDATVEVDRRLAAGTLWLWDDGDVVAMAGRSEPVAGVARIGPVYTPPPVRGRGYASALVGEMSAAALDGGDRCILYTDLENPTSNSIYRALGYRAVAEALRYEFMQ
jgi:predicted GNAT family acetyltransferase